MNTTRLNLFFLWVLLHNCSLLTAQTSASFELNTNDLFYAEVYDNIFRGHFEHVDIAPESSDFTSIFHFYLNTFGKQCPSYLPEDKVKIMKKVCAEERVESNAYGMELSRTCIRWEWVWTGLYAKPDLYAAKVDLENRMREKSLELLHDMIMDDNKMGNTVDMAHKAKGLALDMATFFTQNACNGKAVLRFEENMKRYALGQKSIRIKEVSKYTLAKETGGPNGIQDFAKLLDDLIEDQAKTWMMNKYIGGSITNVKEHAKDANGKPLEISANYKYSGWGNGNGAVRVTFENGLPKCIYFADFPQNCKKPNATILATYAKGNYTE